MQTEAQYIIYKIYGHFYYLRLFDKKLGFVANSEKTVTLPTRLQKEGIEAFVGDYVKIDVLNNTIEEVLPRETILHKPLVANIDLIVIVASVIDPELDFPHLDRLLFLAQMSTKQKPILCISKIDLVKNQDYLRDLQSYCDLGYEIFPISNFSNEGIAQLKEQLLNKVCVVAGKSGVGKSSLLNALCPALKVKTGELSSKMKAGMHTTRHMEIHQTGNIYICDTPGFSRTNIEYTVAEILQKKPFPELQKAEPCFYLDCKHIDEEGCNVRFSPERKASYEKILAEANDWEQNTLVNKKYKNSLRRTKTDSNVDIPLLEKEKRSESRRKLKQSLRMQDFNAQPED